MKKISLIVFFFFTCCIVSFAQIEEDLNTNHETLLSKTKPEKKQYDLSDKIMLGGNFSLTFGSITLIQISPLVGYNLNSYITIGASLTYMYYNYSSDIYNYTAQNYGGGFFIKAKIYKEFYLQAESEWLNIKYLDKYYNSNRKWVFSALAGVTYRSSLGSRFAVDYSVLWNLNQTQDSPYENPVIKVAFVY